jgi:hypothetical protein
VPVPLALAPISLSKTHEVIFEVQGLFWVALWRTCAALLDVAWDHDDAFECSADEEIPVKIPTERYLSFTIAQRVNWHGTSNRSIAYLHASTALRRECKTYFARHPDTSIVIEDIVELLKPLGTRNRQPNPETREQLLEKWYHISTPEVTRWLLLSITLTLRNYSLLCAILTKERMISYQRSKMDL